MGPLPPQIVETRLPVHDVTDAVYLEVLDDVASALAGSGIPHCFIGGLASSVYGRDRHTHDLDLFVRPEDADRTLEVLAGHGFEVERSCPDWIYKAAKRGLLVDVIFMTTDGTVLDPELELHVRTAVFAGRKLPVIAPEDLLITKLSAFREDTAHQWFDCVALLESTELDWHYLMARAREKPHRLLSLLVFVAGSGRKLPAGVLEELFASVQRLGRERAA
ncbi:MAG TPA: nucleotidyltransferase [Candidatus Dormibacteraeota bacterium]